MKPRLRFDLDGGRAQRRQFAPLESRPPHAAAGRTGRARSMRRRRSGECRASHRSLRRCTFSQKSALLPNTRASIRAVSAVIARRSLHNSLTCLRGTPIASARSPCVRPSGSMNSSTRISPTLAGLRYLYISQCGAGVLASARLTSTAKNADLMERCESLRWPQHALWHIDAVVGAPTPSLQRQFRAGAGGAAPPRKNETLPS